MCCRRIKEEKEEVPESEADDERDKRTVFAYQVVKLGIASFLSLFLYPFNLLTSLLHWPTLQISLKADEKDVYEFFSRAGKVNFVKLSFSEFSQVYVIPCPIGGQSICLT